MKNKLIILSVLSLITYLNLSALSEKESLIIKAGQNFGFFSIELNHSIKHNPVLKPGFSGGLEYNRALTQKLNLYTGLDYQSAKTQYDSKYKYYDQGNLVSTPFIKTLSIDYLTLSEGCKYRILKYADIKMDVAVLIPITNLSFKIDIKDQQINSTYHNKNIKKAVPAFHIGFDIPYRNVGLEFSCLHQFGNLITKGVDPKITTINTLNLNLFYQFGGKN